MTMGLIFGLRKVSTLRLRVQSLLIHSSRASCWHFSCRFWAEITRDPLAEASHTCVGWHFVYMANSAYFYLLTSSDDSKQLFVQDYLKHIKMYCKGLPYGGHMHCKPTTVILVLPVSSILATKQLQSFAQRKQIVQTP